MLKRVWREGNPHTLLVGMENGTATVEKSMKVSWNTKNIAIIRSTSGHKSAEKHDPKGYMFSSVHSSTIHNSQDMEVI